MAVRTIAVNTSGQLVTSTVVKAAAGQLFGVSIITDGTNPGSATVHDKAKAATGTILADVQASGASRGTTVMFDPPVDAKLGLYCVVAGEGCKAIVYYR